VSVVLRIAAFSPPTKKNPIPSSDIISYVSSYLKEFQKHSFNIYENLKSAFGYLFEYCLSLCDPKPIFSSVVPEPS
tara:strand:+ start:1054 stop:1281 length:228 start_codon:yes stop_codon:yes gene_type:complete